MLVIERHRISRFSHAGEFIGSIRPRIFGFDWLLVRDGILFANGLAFPDGDHRFHVLTHAGDHLRSFGGVLEDPAKFPYGAASALGSARDDTSFWAAPPNRYRLERWATDGRFLEAIENERDWFPPWPGTNIKLDEPPPPGVVDLLQTPDSLLWVLLRVSRDDYELPVDRRRLQTPAGILGMFDAVIEVLDPGKGTLVTRRRFNRSFSRFVGRDRIQEFIEANDGTVAIVVSQLEVAFGR